MKHPPMQDGNRSGPEPYLYCWDYSEQVKADCAHAQKAKRRGAMAYALVMVFFFLLLTAALIFSVLWFGDAPKASEQPILSTADVAEELLPSVVLIYAAGDTSAGYGTGFFIRADGYIATNAHVVSGREHLTVTLYSGDEYEAKLVGMSTVDDLAVLKIKGNNYPAVRIGNSRTTRIGETAIAIGNPSGDEAPWSVTQGIVSAKNRIVPVETTYATIELTMLQFDAPVNGGNSGGPLCNDRGEVIGIVTRKIADDEGIGLALPINGSMVLLEAIIETGSVKGVVSSISRVRPMLGITVVSIQKGETVQYGQDTITAPEDGVLINSVASGSAADGTLQPGDIILSIGGERVKNIEDLTEQLYNYRAGQSIQLRVWRSGEETAVTVRLK